MHGKLNHSEGALVLCADETPKKAYKEKSKFFYKDIQLLLQS
jgi:hypothetical protein